MPCKSCRSVASCGGRMPAMSARWLRVRTLIGHSSVAAASDWACRRRDRNSRHELSHPKASKHAGKVCVCELVPLFDISQPTLSHHLKKLREAGIVDSERRGLWAYYDVVPDAMEELSAWLR